MIDIWVRFTMQVFTMQVQKFGGLSAKKIWGQNMRNLAQFYTTSDFDHEYISGTGQHNPKLERYVIENDFSGVNWNKSGKLWSTIQKVGHGPTQIDFFGRLYFSPWRCWPYALEFDQGLIVHTTKRIGVPKNFNGEQLKLGLKSASECL